MTEALAWGALAASSLVIGALLAFVRPWRGPALGLILAFGAGALISAVSFELFAEGVETGGPGWTGLGLGAGAIAYYVLDGLLERRSSSGSTGTALALGAFLDGVPEQLVLGISVASGEGVGVGLLAAIFVSNLPEAIGSASEMHDGGAGREKVLRLWAAIAVACVLATGMGYAAADSASSELTAGIEGFAAGALLVMMIDSMIPEARRVGGRAAGLVTVLGFATAAALSLVAA